MLKLIAPIIAVAALAAPAAALANHRDGHHQARDKAFATRLVRIERRMHPAASFVRLHGTGAASFASPTVSVSGSVLPASTGATFSAGLTTTWASATTKTLHMKAHDNDATVMTVTVTCAPAQASLTLASSGSSTLSAFTGKTCAINRNGTIVYHFGGADSTGIRLFLREKGTGIRGLLGTVPGSLFNR